MVSGKNSPTMYNPIWSLHRSRSLNECKSTLGTQLRNMKVEFMTGGTWHQVGQCILIMKIYDFFIRLSHLVSVYNNINKKHKDGRFFFILLLQTETKRLSRIKKIIYFHY